MKVSLPDVNQFSGNCLRMVCKVSKQNCFEIKISQRHVIVCVYMVFSVGHAKCQMEAVA